MPGFLLLLLGGHPICRLRPSMWLYSCLPNHQKSRTVDGYACSVVIGGQTVAEVRAAAS